MAGQKGAESSARANYVKGPWARQRAPEARSGGGQRAAKEQGAKSFGARACAAREEGAWARKVRKQGSESAPFQPPPFTRTV